MLIYAIAVLGLNLLVGYSGQISLGHGAFFCLGAYTGAILLDRTVDPAPADRPGRRPRVLRRRPRARPARAAAARALPRAGHARAGDRDAGADQALRRPHRRQPGPHRRPAQAALLVRPRRRPEPLLHRADRGRPAVLVRGGRRAARQRARADRDARRRDGGAHDGRQPGDVQDARVRAQRRLRGHRGRALHVRQRLRGARVVHAHGLVRVPGRDRRRRAGDGGGSAVRRALHRLRAGVDVGRRRGAVGRDLRGDADRVHVRVPRRGHGRAAERRGAWSTKGRSEDEVAEVAVAGDGRRAGAGAGGVRS